MHASIPDSLHSWHDFYMLAGTASATLVGLMFVSASIGAQIFSPRHGGALRAFISPTVVHFSSALFVCVLLMVPSHSFYTLAGLLVAGGLGGVLYSGRLWVQLYIQRRFAVDLVDRLFYALIPFVAYLLVMGSGGVLFSRSTAGLDLLAAAVAMLMLAGVRNAWDMTIWIVLRSPTAENIPEPPLPDGTRPPQSGAATQS